ncbi:hypothetical protein [Candidatus Thiosymbion oneisti]|uniref:hypothetical protein n=1 Tax=Candidatus Thiosymbion oneisti TaxID=589554 RepID=UPI00114C9EFA|nr:hypothetical protein [Candidatus Thiosymbion oneisti]
MNRYTSVPLADVIQQNKDYIAAPELKVYPKLSIKLYGKGVVLDTPAATDLVGAAYPTSGAPVTGRTDRRYVGEGAVGDGTYGGSPKNCGH